MSTVASTSQPSSAAAAESDALASVITQVSQNAQPVRAPVRQPQRRKAKPTPVQPKTTSETVTTGTLPEPITLPSTSHTTPHHLIDEKKAAPTEDSATLSETPKPSHLKHPSSLKSAQAAPKKKKTSPWHAFLAALGCASSSQQGNFDDSRRPSADRTRSQHNATHQSEMQERQKAASPAEGASTTMSSEPEAGPSTASTAVTRPPATPLHGGDSESDEMMHSQEVAANSSRLGAQLSREETGDVLSGAVVPPGADGHTPTGTPMKRRSRTSQKGLAEDSEPEISDEDERDEFLDEQDEEDRIIQQGGMGIPIGEDGQPRPLLSALDEGHAGRKCLVLDLDETLVHSSFKMIQPADYIVPVEIENQVHNVYVIKRPGVDEFLRRMGELYEVVVFTASLSKYADPVLDQLDVHRVVRHRLFRESCYNHKGNYVKDLSQLGRPVGSTIIIDNSPASYIFHPKNAVPVSSWFNDPHDTELTDMVGVLADLSEVEDVRAVLDTFFYADE